MGTCDTIRNLKTGNPEIKLWVDPHVVVVITHVCYLS